MRLAHGEIRVAKPGRCCCCGDALVLFVDRLSKKLRTRVAPAESPAMQMREELLLGRRERMWK